MIKIILTRRLAEVIYAQNSIVTYCNVSAYMKSARRPIKISWVIKGVILFCCIKRLKEFFYLLFILNYFYDIY